MKAKILGKLSIDKNKIKNEISVIEESGFDDAYKEYSIGKWRTKSIWNQNGINGEAISKEYCGHAKRTFFSNQLTYINEIISKNFNTKYIKPVRVLNSCENGMIFPHKDYLEFKKGFNRVHVVLYTDKNCLNSEKDTIYHMRAGEVWYVDGSNIHSAMSLSEKGKFTLIIDFCPDISLEKIFSRNSSVVKDNIEPFVKYDIGLNQFLIQKASTNVLKKNKPLKKTLCNGLSKKCESWKNIKPERFVFFA
ncbi:aspartyl/asparaginyl beta-hydroxylase domain-containing protein [Endozoicomonas sp. ISHI1]|uniref:aspartyl/asparaginyl beta-hydroxylase domain-containing protein n=1 Tax=Endozoicomonas sp. ISHI1 TaxID=2825882 RepID=UPI002148463B|nr:aspartyl/asparaginyl beta-hydroxylase domain-containing protein [Endozoicomonas sp. ISHI1]